MINERQNYRLRKQFDLTWSIPEQKIEGEAIVFNISLSGMLFVTDRLFEPKHGLTMGFSVAQVPSFPSKGRLVWFRKVGQGGSQYQCGAKFLNTPSPSWITWMEDNILKLADTEDSRILDRMLNEGQEA